jgi:hypothetical protein
MLLPEDNSTNPYAAPQSFDANATEPRTSMLGLLRIIALSILIAFIILRFFSILLAKLIEQP